MDFLGSTTPQDLLASVTSGVQTTGSALWPIVALVGVPLAFTIASMLISFVKHNVGRTRKN